MNKLLLFFAGISLFVSCNNTNKDNDYFLRFDSDKILYTGRVNFDNDSAAIVYWPGTSIKVRFSGTGIEMQMTDSHSKNYYNIIIDNDSVFILHPDSVKTWYTLANGLNDGEHIVEVFKRTEWNQGPSYIYAFKAIDSTKFLPAPKRSDKTIEFFGNSITAGYADRDTVGDSPDSLFTDNYVAYGALTARHYNANYYCTARGGIGITISWYPLIMEQMYYRLDPFDSTSRWDFSKVTPDIVVINVLQNDSWLVNMPAHPEFKARFGTEKPSEEYIIGKYISFVKKIRKEYPEANIVCALGSMDAVAEGSPWPGYIKTAVDRMNDDKIFTYVFPYMQKGKHPKVADQRVMADSLINFIDRNKLWY